LFNLRNRQLKKGYITCILSSFLILTGANTAIAKDVIPIETLSKLPALTNFSISRDGDYLVASPANPVIISYP